MRVLLAEDNEMLQELTMAGWRSTSWIRIQPVMDGQTATKIIRQNAVIIKPYTAEELVAALQKSLWPKANAA